MQSACWFLYQIAFKYNLKQELFSSKRNARVDKQDKRTFVDVDIS